MSLDYIRGLNAYLMLKGSSRIYDLSRVFLHGGLKFGGWCGFALKFIQLDRKAVALDSREMAS